jgi:hypothetical protein
MIDSVDLVLRETITAALPALTSRIGFQRPDDDWRQRIATTPGVWLNCYLADLREDRHRRSTARWTERVDGADLVRSAPFLLRCEYVLSAWNTARDSTAVAATEQEHRVLGDVLEALVDAVPLSPAAVLTPSEMAGVPAGLRDAVFDTQVAPPEGYPKLAELWGGMARPGPLRPVVPVVLTVPVPARPQVAEGVVETIVTSLGPDALLVVGGRVLDASGPNTAAPVPVRAARVGASTGGRLVARAVSDDDGRFVLDGLPPGRYTFDVRAAALPPPAPVTVDVPATTGSLVELRFV